MFDLQTRAEVLAFAAPIFRAFREKSATPLYLVGGCVRDLILGYPVKDLDFTTSARPEQVREILTKLGAKVVEKNGGNFGTVHAIWKDWDIEITTYRVDKDYPLESRRPEVEFSTNLQDDLRRRDFTINAGCMDALGQYPQVCASYLNDILERRLTSPQDPMKLFQDDPLRILRMYRFWYKYDLTIAFDLRQAARRCAHLIKYLSRERIHDELIKIAGGKHPHLAFRSMMEDGVLQQIIPELSSQVGYDQWNPHHDRPLWEHTLSVVEGLPASASYQLVLAALLHDVGKPRTIDFGLHCEKCYASVPYTSILAHKPCSRCQEGTYSQKVGHYTNHDVVGADVTCQILERLKFSNDDIEFISGLVRHHNIGFSAEWSFKTVRRFVNRVGTLLGPLLTLARADRAAHAPTRQSPRSLDELEHIAATIDLSEVIKPKPLVSGNEVMSVLGLEPGPKVGAVLDQILNQQIDGIISTRDMALGYLYGLKGVVS